MTLPGAVKFQESSFISVRGGPVLDGEVLSRLGLFL